MSDLFTHGLVVGWVLGCCFAVFIGFCAESTGYEKAAKDSLADNPSPKWRKALIDAEAERAKEAIK